jgi:hypothetical protein
VAWAGQGWDIAAGGWRQIALPVNGAPTIFSLVREGVPHFLGPVAGQPWSASFYGALRGAPARTALLVPIRLKGRAAAWLYGDGGEDDILAIDVPSMISLCGRAAFALQIMILRNKILST